MKTLIKFAVVFIFSSLIIYTSAGAKGICPEDDYWTTAGGEGYVVTEEKLAEDTLLRIHYRVLRVGAQANVPIWVIMPEVPGDSSVGKDYAEELSLLPKEATVVTFDPRGSGCSRPQGITRFQATLLSPQNDVADLRKVIDHLFGNSAKVSLFGKRYGATLAILYTVEYPRSVDTMIAETPLFLDAYPNAAKKAKKLVTDFLAREKKASAFITKIEKKLAVTEGAQARSTIENYIATQLAKNVLDTEITAALEKLSNQEAPFMRQPDILGKVQLDVFLPVYCRNFVSPLQPEKNMKDPYGRDYLCKHFFTSKDDGLRTRDKLPLLASSPNSKIAVILGEKSLIAPQEVFEKSLSPSDPIMLFLVPKSGDDPLNENKACTSYIFEAVTKDNKRDAKGILSAPQCAP